MSRGFGKKQLAILAHLEAVRGSTSFEAMRWALFDEAYPASAGDLTSSWDTSLSRAMGALVEAGEITVESRDLTGLEEMAVHYPYKTYARTVRKLREALLPDIVSWELSGKGLPRKYSPKDNEDYFLKHTRPEQLAAVRSEWLPIEIDILKESGGGIPDDVLLLICKGRFLLEERKPHSRPRAEFNGSLGQSIDDCHNRNLLSPSILGALRSLYDKLNPPSARSHLGFKSVIYAYTDMYDTNNSVKIRKEAIELLDQRKGSELVALGGLKPRPPRSASSFQFLELGGVYGPQITPLMHKLFDRSLFTDFRFITKK